MVATRREMTLVDDATNSEHHREESRAIVKRIIDEGIGLFNVFDDKDPDRFARCIKNAVDRYNARMEPLELIIDAIHMEEQAWGRNDGLSVKISTKLRQAN